MNCSACGKIMFVSYDEGLCSDCYMKASMEDFRITVLLGRVLIGTAILVAIGGALGLLRLFGVI